MRERINRTRLELRKTEGHNLMQKTANTHYVSSRELRFGVLTAIQKKH